MATTSYPSPAELPRPRPSIVPASLLQWLTWALVVTLVLGPFLPLAYASIRDRPLYESGGVFTLEPYRELLRERAFWHAWWNTLQFAVLTTAMAVALGAAVAILCARTNLPGRQAFSRLVLLPLLLPSLGMVLGWIAVWGEGGYVTSFFNQRLHIGVPAIDTIFGMALVEATRLMPVAFLTCQAALVRADSSLEDAARSAGAAPLRVLRSITIPMLRPALLNSATLIFTRPIPARSARAR